ncbi:MAG: aminopeptidase P family protein [Gemmiger sp.]|uniref:aminopeptidase P family protein n=1 Tax=Gemmiger sp. TaxID=2049027 RepID=UPI002E77C91F|nr:aminopeptidase P family protein [Gemmiger sp.]MEE0801233.1 aminopeptidase P family protein [Gemmiger sp.]
MTTNEKISALRSAAKAAGGSGVLLMTSDPHCSEYLPDYYNSLPWFSGFTGENSTLVVTMQGSALWCDGRFYVQADKQLAGTEIACMHAGSAGVPTVAEYLADHFGAGDTLLLDGSCVPATTAHTYEQALAAKGAALKSLDIVTPLWESLTDRPQLPNTPCRLLTPEQTGATAAERIEMVRAELRKAGATALAVTGLDCVGWLTNVRALDLPCTPLAVAYALVTMDSCTLFIAPGRLSEADAATLHDNGVTLRDYPELLEAVHALPAEEVFLVDEKATNYELYRALCEHRTVAGPDPIFALKGIKNPVELANIRECHIRDGVAVVRFQMDLEKALAEGKTLHETDIEVMLQRRRSEMPGYFEDSFGTIAAYGPNAAMMHYHAGGDVDSVIEPHGFLLVDNGGQYDCGTTDITRTYPVGPLTDNERRYYTWTLQCHIDIARAVFLDYCTGFALDSFARGPLWAHKINYRCGTGHGVGFISGVHEGPQSLRPQNDIVFKPGMTITDEPGVYETDEVGIRIENELECVDAGENQYGHWLRFEPLTLAPISTEPVLVDELTRTQIDWLNAYHAHVYEMLSPRLNEEEKAWLKAKTAPIGR